MGKRGGRWGRNVSRLKGGRGWTDLTSQPYAVQAGVGAYHDVGLCGSAADARGRVLLQPLEVTHETLARGCAHGAHLACPLPVPTKARRLELCLEDGVVARTLPL